jgi:uncharacterized surface protein with fasciclin (FAS1) repeats
MKTKQLTKLALLASLAAATPIALAQQSPAGGAGTSGTNEPGANTLRPGRPASQPGSSATGQSNAQQRQLDAAERQADAQRQAGAAQDAAQKSTVTEIISEGTTYSTLEKALKAADLDATLDDQQGSFTLFAPTDEAFDKLPAGTLNKLLRAENKDKLRSILLNHVVSGKMMAADLKSGNLKTLSGETIQLSATAGDVQVGGSKVSTADRVASNGVVHAIGEVLIPKSVNLQELE